MHNSCPHGFYHLTARVRGEEMLRKIVIKEYTTRKIRISALGETQKIVIMTIPSNIVIYHLKSVLAFITVSFHLQIKNKSYMDIQ